MEVAYIARNLDKVNNNSCRVVSVVFPFSAVILGPQILKAMPASFVWNFDNVNDDSCRGVSSSPPFQCSYIGPPDFEIDNSILVCYMVVLYLIQVEDPLEILFQSVAHTGI